MRGRLDFAAFYDGNARYALRGVALRPYKNIARNQSVAVCLFACRGPGFRPERRCTPGDCAGTTHRCRWRVQCRRGALLNAPRCWRAHGESARLGLGLSGEFATIPVCRPSTVSRSPEKLTLVVPAEAHFAPSAMGQRRVGDG